MPLLSNRSIKLRQLTLYPTTYDSHPHPIPHQHQKPCKCELMGTRFWKLTLVRNFRKTYMANSPGV